MKKWIVIFLVLALAAGCTPAAPEVDPNLIYTQAAQTVQAQLTNEAAKIPPTETTAPTNTPEPSPTITNTPEPTLVPTRAWAFNPPGKVTAPILLYNVIADSTDDDPYYQWESPYNIPSAQFQQEMMVLKEMGYTPVTFGYLSNVVWQGGEMPPKPIVITIDSTKLGVYKKAFPILKQLGFVATVFVTVNQINGTGTMTSGQINELVAAGWEIGSKSWTGNNLVDLLANSPDSISDEISGSRLELERLFGVPVVSFSYPQGAIDASGIITTRVQEWGYKSAAGLFKSPDHSLNTIYYMPRYEILKDLPIEDFKTILPWKADSPAPAQPAALPATATLAPGSTIAPGATLPVLVTPAP